MNFEKAVQALADCNVEFIIIGGWSAILHGSTHVTNDLDLFFSRAPANLRRLAVALAPYHPRPRKLPFVWGERTLANGTIFTLKTDLGMIDLLAEVAGLGSFDYAPDGSTRSCSRVDGIPNVLTVGPHHSQVGSRLK